MVFKNSMYTILDGKLYALIEARSDVPILKGDIKYFLSDNERYVPNIEHFIMRNQLQNLFNIRTYALYEGYKVGVFNYKNNESGECNISSNDFRIGENLGLRRIGENLFNKIVKIDELDSIWEEVEPVDNYSLPSEMSPLKILWSKD
jgi:hypothetical protein